MDVHRTSRRTSDGRPDGSTSVGRPVGRTSAHVGRPTDVPSDVRRTSDGLPDADVRQSDVRRSDVCWKSDGRRAHSMGTARARRAPAKLRLSTILTENYQKKTNFFESFFRRFGCRQASWEAGILTARSSRLPRHATASER